jgi:hypothetical protein
MRYEGGRQMHERNKTKEERGIRRKDKNKSFGVEFQGV